MRIQRLARAGLVMLAFASIVYGCNDNRANDPTAAPSAKCAPATPPAAATADPDTRDGIRAGMLNDLCWNPGNWVTGVAALDPVAYALTGRAKPADTDLEHTREAVQAHTDLGFAYEQKKLFPWTHPGYPGVTLYTEEGGSLLVIKVVVGNRAGYAAPLGATLPMLDDLIARVGAATSSLSLGAPIADLQYRQSGGERADLRGFVGLISVK